MNDRYEPDQEDLRVTEVNLERPLVPFDDWARYQKVEHRSMVLGNIIAGVIIVAVTIVIMLVLTQ
jgi:hypothetical protein